MSKLSNGIPVAGTIEIPRSSVDYLQSAHNNSPSAICNAIKAMPSIEPDMISSAASALLKYAASVERFMSNIDLSLTLNKQLDQAMVSDFEPITYNL